MSSQLFPRPQTCCHNCCVGLSVFGHGSGSTIMVFLVDLFVFCPTIYSLFGMIFLVTLLGCFLNTDKSFFLVQLALVQFMVLDSQTPETPNIPNFENIGSPGVQTPETPKTLKMLRQLGVSGVWTPGLPIPLKYGILGVSGVWESGLPKPSILVVLGVQESNQLTIA